MDIWEDVLGWLKSPTVQVVVLVVALLLPLPILWGLVAWKEKETTASEDDEYTAIVPLKDFDWTKTEPIRLRPFKPKFHLTMALTTLPMSELLAMDKTYLDRIKWRRELMAKHQTDTVLALPGSEAMVNELYIWLFGTYLPRRYPRIFTLIAPAITSSGYSKDDRSLYLRNRITQESVSLTPPTDPVAALTTISSHIDTDFLLLAPQPDEEPEAEEKYHLLALANCCPSGFSPKEKLGLPLNQIHAPVPAYASKLEKSMDRFFASLPRGKVVARANWTVQLDGELFCLKGNHGDKDGPLEGEELRTERERVDVSKCRLRAERQTLHRLSETGALVFAFKTYLYPFKDVKDEGLGEDMAEAIEGLGSGSVPEMPAYKRREVWGDKVAAYLRSTE